MKKIKVVFQAIGALALGLLAVYGVLTLAGQAELVGALASGVSQRGAASSLAPPVINYQGTLRNIDGSAINDAFTMTFRLYDDPVGGTTLYSEVIQDVMVRDSLFTVLLGDMAPGIDPEIFKGALYVGVQVESDAEMAPRQRLAPVGYAVQLTNGVFVDRDGKVGIGTQDPQAQLDVGGDMNVSGDASVSGDLIIASNMVVTGTLAHPGETFVGPHFLDPRVTIIAPGTCSPRSWTWISFANDIPEGVTAVILEYIAQANAGNGQGIFVRKDPSSTGYVLGYGRAYGSGDEVGWGGQGTFPVAANRSIEYFVGTFNQGCELYLIGYYK